MSVRIETEDLAAAVGRRPFAYVASAGSDGVAHLRAVVCDHAGAGFHFRVGQRTATNVRETGRVTLVWPPLSGHDSTADYDDHSVIADCTASIDPAVDDNGDMYLIVVPTSAVWHRPARR
jgi:hypothetical protein